MKISWVLTLCYCRFPVYTFVIYVRLIRRIITICFIKFLAIYCNKICIARFKNSGKVSFAVYMQMMRWIWNCSSSSCSFSSRFHQLKLEIMLLIGEMFLRVSFFECQKSSCCWWRCLLSFRFLRRIYCSFLQFWLKLPKVVLELHFVLFFLKQFVFIREFVCLSNTIDRLFQISLNQNWRFVTQVKFYLHFWELSEELSEVSCQLRRFSCQWIALFLPLSKLVVCSRIFNILGFFLSKRTVFWVYVTWSGDFSKFCWLSMVSSYLIKYILYIYIFTPIKNHYIKRIWWVHNMTLQKKGVLFTLKFYFLTVPWQNNSLLQLFLLIYKSKMRSKKSIIFKVKAWKSEKAFFPPERLNLPWS